MQLRSFPVIDRTVGSTPELTVVAAHEAPGFWRRALEVLQPHRWLLPMVSLGCGVAISSGDSFSKIGWATLAMALALVGPLVTGAGYAIHAYFDRDVQELDGLGRLVLSGRATTDAVVATIGVLSLVSLLVAHQLGSFAFNVASLTLALFFALNAPPLRLRRQTWWNSLCFGLVSVGTPWILGQSLVGAYSQNSILLACIFAFGALGLQLLDSLHRGAGERRAGLRTLAALLGPEVGAGIAAVVIETSLLGAAIIGFGNQAVAAASGLLAVMAAQLVVLLLGVRRLDHRGLFTAVSFGLFMLAMLLAASSFGHQVLEL